MWNAVNPPGLPPHSSLLPSTCTHQQPALPQPKGNVTQKGLTNPLRPLIWEQLTVLSLTLFEGGGLVLNFGREREKRNGTKYTIQVCTPNLSGMAACQNWTTGKFEDVPKITFYGHINISESYFIYFIFSKFRDGGLYKHPVVYVITIFAR